jgi:endonuclease/exonuclease/phosphatase family metal-dependent hydrolase
MKSRLCVTTSYAKLIENSQVKVPTYKGAIRMMRKLFLPVMVLALLAITRTYAAEPFRINVLSYNIHHGEGVDRKLDLERIAGVIRSVSPDVVALQEVDYRTERTNRVDQPAELARLTKMQVVFEKNIEFQGGEYGNAVLSRLPVAGHNNVHLPSFDNGEQRGVLTVELKMNEGGESLLFLCTHLDHRSNGRERLASAKQINALIRERGDIPAILAGDLNATRDSEVLRVFEEQWQLASQTELPTVPVAEPGRQIDFILFRPSHRWSVVETRVLEEAVASDHRAVFATLELR